MDAAHVRELQTSLLCQTKIVEAKVVSHHKMRDQSKRAATVLDKDKVNAQKKLKKNAVDSESIIGEAYQNISQLKHEVSFQKEEIDRERIAGD